MEGQGIHPVTFHYISCVLGRAVVELDCTMDRACRLEFTQSRWIDFRQALIALLGVMKPRQTGTECQDVVLSVGDGHAS